MKLYVQNAIINILEHALNMTVQDAEEVALDFNFKF